MSRIYCFLGVISYYTKPQNDTVNSGCSSLESCFMVTDFTMIGAEVCD